MKIILDPNSSTFENDRLVVQEYAQSIKTITREEEAIKKLIEQFPTVFRCGHQSAASVQWTPERRLAQSIKVKAIWATKKKHEAAT